MTLKNLIVAGIMPLCPLATFATDYYAKPGGTGDGSTYAKAGNITTMRGKPKAGDVLYLLGGQYDLKSTLTFGNSGTEGNMITICAYEGEGPILDFRQQAYSSNAVKLSGNYIHIKGITIRYAGYKGLINEGSYNIMENLVVYGCCDTGIQQKNGGYNTIKNCDSYDNFDYKTYGENADGFADKQHSGGPNTYIGCRAWNNSDDGWDFYQRVGGTTIFIDCVCYANGPATYDMTQNPRYETDKGFFDESGSSPSSFPNTGNGNGFKLGGSNTVHNVTLYRCLSVGNTIKGFDQNNNKGAMKLLNCTAYNNGRNYGFTNNNGHTLEVRNSISLAGPKRTNGDSFQSGVTTQSNNTWNSGFSVSNSDFQSLDEATVLSPRNADGSLAEVALLHLSSTSGLIDKGMLLGTVDGIETTYNGPAPDLGCFETAESSGIDAVAQDGAPDGNVLMYNLAGQRVGRSYRGVVIQGGKKRVR